MHYCIALDFTKSEVFRDLSKPIGALNDKKLEKYKVSVNCLINLSKSIR